MIKRTCIYLALVSATLYAVTAFGAPAAKPAGAPAGMVKVAVCKDGKTYYHATGERRGACSGHGGVDTYADGSKPKTSGGRSAVR